MVKSTLFVSVGVAVVALIVASAHAQTAATDYYYGVGPAPSMNAQMVGQAYPVAGFVNEQGQQIPAAPSMDAIMAGNQMQPNAQYGQYEAQGAAFVEQPQYVPAQAQAAAPYFATQEAQEHDEEEDESDVEADEEETEDESEDVEDADEARFAEKHDKGGKKNHGKKHHGKKHHKKEKKHHAKKHHKGGKKHGHGGKHAHGGKHGKHGKGGKGGKKMFKPKLGKPSNDARSPSAKTPKSAGGRKLPPMPAPLPKKKKIDCKKNPQRCITAETPAEGEEPGDHSPKAVFKKKMEVIREALLKNNRNIAEELKWLDQVDTIMKKYKLKSTKVREHITDERKAIKELLRQRRIILNEKKQKELEMKLKMATTELSALTDALSQVQKKEKDLASGKGQLGGKIKLLVGDLKKLRTSNAADKKQSLKKSF